MGSKQSGANLTATLGPPFKREPPENDPHEEMQSGEEIALQVPLAEGSQNPQEEKHRSGEAGRQPFPSRDSSK